MERPTPEVVRIGRLEKKIRKLKRQLAATKEQNAFFNEVLRYYPYSRRTYGEKMRQQLLAEFLAAIAAITITFGGYYVIAFILKIIKNLL